MTNYKKKNRLTRSSLITSMKKTISIVIVILLMFSLIGCGDSSDNNNAQTSGSNENRVTTEEEMSTQERAGDPIDKPNQDIEEEINLLTDTVEDNEDATTEADDNSQSQGTYTYTIYDGIEISMGVNLDDYIRINKKGDKFFNIYDLARNLGWEIVNPDDDGYSRSFEYKTTSGPYIDFIIQTIGSADTPDGWESYDFSGIHDVIYDFTEGSPYYHMYYSEDEAINNKEHSGSHIDMHNYECDGEYYGMGGAIRATVSRDDAIMMAYLLWEAQEYDGASKVYSILEKYISDENRDMYSFDQYNIE